MSAHKRYAALVLIAVLAAGCRNGDISHGTPPSSRPSPPPSSPAAGPSGNAGAPQARAADPRPFTLVASGDVMPSYPAVLETAQDDAPSAGYDYRPMLAGVKSVIASADLALCQLDAPLGPLEGPFTGHPVAQAPPQLATALKETGYDSCSTASNHTLDQGVAGVDRTLKALDTVGLRHTGSARSAAEGARPAMLRTRGGARVAHLAYTYGTDGKARPAAAPWAVAAIDERRIAADARAARRAGADVVVVSLHWGTEYRTAPDERQVALARALTAARAGSRPAIDLITGSHAHTPQPYEKVNGTWVVYGLGDQISGAMRKPQGNWGSIARFRFAPPDGPGARWRVTKAEYIPQAAAQGPPVRMLNLGKGSMKKHVKARKAIKEAVLGRGAARDGLTRGK